MGVNAIKMSRLEKKPEVKHALNVFFVGMYKIKVEVSSQYN